MITEKRIVAVMQMPEEVDAKQEQIFLSEVKKCVNDDRPRLVLDCSKMQKVNQAAIHLMLACLEEAMKRNGDVKLAALPPGSSDILKHTAIHRVFDIYDTATEAVNSFHLPPTRVTPRAGEDVYPKKAETAA